MILALFVLPFVDDSRRADSHVYTDVEILRLLGRTGPACAPEVCLIQP